MNLYKFRWEDNGEEIVNIDANPTLVCRLLNEYRAKAETYNMDDFVTYLRQHGIKAEQIIIDSFHNLYF